MKPYQVIHHRDPSIKGSEQQLKDAIGHEENLEGEQLIIHQGFAISLFPHAKSAKFL